MMYLLPTASDNMAGMSKEKFGVIRTPYGGNAWGIKNGYRWAADNGAFTEASGPAELVKWLDKEMHKYRDTNLFVVCPDKVFDSKGTLELFDKWRPSLKDWPVAFVAQNGQEDLDFPPPDLWDCLFIGGTTEWKLSRHALECIKRAKCLGKKVHVGRVNSAKRVKHFMLSGVDSVDGTAWRFAPDHFKRIIPEWMSYSPFTGVDL